MALLGPAPAVALGARVHAASTRLYVRQAARRDCSSTSPTFAAFAAARRARDPRARRRLRPELRRSAVVRRRRARASSWPPNTLNFADGRRRPLVRRTASRSASCCRSFVTALPSRVRDRAADGGRRVHLRTPRASASVGLAAVVLFVFLYILRTSVQAEERGEELAQRTRELASLQMGLLSTVLQTLSMRDAMTARHSAAVARYSREVAGMLGLDEREQDLIHTAALLHDIGKFILPGLGAVREPQAHQRGMGADQAPSGAGREAGRAHRGLRPGRRDRPAPPREVRRRRLSRPASRATRSRSARGSSPSPTPTT